MILGIIGWIVVGLIAGVVASKVVTLRGDDAWLGIAAAVGGAVVAGVLYSVISGAGVTAWNPWGLLVATAGGVAGAVTWHLIRSRSISHATYKPRSSY
jgi:uncharacterized membrane protein YeaQ/YmgE (transglycosylase-associated protein family)